MNLTPENTMERILNGENVTPNNRTEYFVKQAIDNAGSGGGGGDEYETVAEIAVGDMAQQGGIYFYQIPQDVRPEVPRGSDALFFNSADYPLTWIESGTIYSYNFSGEGAPLDSPAYALALDGTDVIALYSDTNAIENTTVKILKKVSGGDPITVDSELSETSENPVQNKVITAALAGLKPTYEFGFTVTAGQTEGEFIVTPDSGSTYAAIAAALAETPNVYAVLDLGFQNQVIRARFSVDSTVSGAETTSASCMFWAGTKWMGVRLIVSASGEGIIVRDA